MHARIQNYKRSNLKSVADASKIHIQNSHRHIVVFSMVLNFISKMNMLNSFQVGHPGSYIADGFSTRFEAGLLHLLSPLFIVCC